MSWLESADEDLSEPATPARIRPPRLPGASRTLPPMPVVPSQTKRPPRRATMEVDMKWVEVVDDPPAKKSDPPAKAAKKSLPKPLKREEE